MVDWSLVVSIVALAVSVAVAVDNFFPQLVIGLGHNWIAINPYSTHLNIELWNASSSASVIDIVASVWVADAPISKRRNKKRDQLYFRGDMTFLGPLKGETMTTLGTVNVEENEFNSFVAQHFPAILRVEKVIEGRRQFAIGNAAPLRILVEVQYRPALAWVFGRLRRKSRAAYKATPSVVVPPTQHEYGAPYISWQFERIL